jgi:two-component system chemotaxis response regulator CheY
MISREAILTALTRELLRTRRAGTPVGVVIAELDHVRTLTETHGQKGAHFILTEVARRLRTGLRDGDHAGCLDDGESVGQFLIVAPECNPGQAAPLAERLRQRVSQEPVRFQMPGEEAVELSVTMSLGTFDVQRDAETDATAVLTEVQKAVQEAKGNGCNRVCQGLPTAMGARRASTAKEAARPLVAA